MAEELLANGGSREQTLPNKNNPNPDLSDAEADRARLADLPADLSPLNSPQPHYADSSPPPPADWEDSEEEINVT
ncbi:hypothetical protein B566_EDAN012416 [Ephemera danica]|nr:hypothetical protein B566_EDAN012416 [Ephemera danica]